VTNAANITLTGSSSNILNITTSGNGLANFATNAASGSFTLAGKRNFTTAGNFSNSGKLTVNGGSAFDVGGTLSNFNSTTNTLTGGTFSVGGTLEFTGANLVTNASNLTLSGSSYRIIDQSGNNALAGFSNNAKAGVLTLAGNASFTAPGSFSNAGQLTVDKGSIFTVNSPSTFTNSGKVTVKSGGTVDVAGSLTNFSSGTLKGGTYTVGGTFEFAGANIVTNASHLTLTGTTAQILNASTHANGLANFASNASTGTFSLQSGSALTTVGNFSNAGTFILGSGTGFTVGGAGLFTQTAGTTTDDGTLTDSGGLNLTGGSLFGKGVVVGSVTNSGGVVNPGDSSTVTAILTDKGAYAQTSTGTLDISIGGTTTGTFDQLNSTTASLNGTLNISLANGFVPAVGSTFKIMDFNSKSGTFALVNGLSINSSEHFTITYQGSDVVLTVVSGPAPAGAKTPLRWVHTGSGRPLFGFLGRPLGIFGSRIHLPTRDFLNFRAAVTRGPDLALTAKPRLSAIGISSHAASATVQAMPRGLFVGLGAANPRLNLAPSQIRSFGASTAPAQVAGAVRFGSLAAFPVVMGLHNVIRPAPASGGFYLSQGAIGVVAISSHSLPRISAAMNFGMTPAAYSRHTANYDAGFGRRFNASNFRSTQSGFRASRLGNRSLTGGIFLPLANLGSKPQVGFGMQ